MYTLIRRKTDQDEYNTLSRPFGSGRRSIDTTHSFTAQSSLHGGRTVYDYNSDIDIKSSTTFEPGGMSRTPSIPLVHMTDVRRISGHSSRSGSFSSIDPNELAYANVSDTKEDVNFDDPVYEQIKGGEEITHNPLYDSTKKKTRRVTGNE